MKKIYSLFLMLTGWFSATAQDGGERYKDSIFSSSEKTTVEYGKNTNYRDQQETLSADIYTPANDTAANRAMIIYAHGGGFKSGHRDDTACVELCKKLVKKGYVTASIDYRVGYNEPNTPEQINAMLRAVQDLNAFIRYARANADSLKIDSSNIFIAGSSAGGITVLAKAYLKVDSVAVSLGIASTADLEGKTNELPFSSSVAGVFSMWGALYDTNWVQKDDIPVGFAHSQGDSTVPFISGYNKQNRSLLLYGSQSIYNRAVSLGITTALHVYNSSKHDLGIKVFPYKDTTVQLIADFFYKILQEQQTKASSFLKSPGEMQQTVTDEMTDDKIFSEGKLNNNQHGA